MKSAPGLRFLCLVPPALALLSAFGAAQATGSSTGSLAGSSAGITINHGWTTATSNPGGIAHGFFTIHNAGPAPDVLTRVTCPVARKTVIQDARRHDVANLLIKTGQTIQLTPAGLHLVLEHLHFRFHPQADIPCSAVFRDAGTMIIYLHVEPAGATSYQPNASRSGSG